MQNALFESELVTDIPLVTVSDSYIGSTPRRKASRRIGEKPVTNCHPSLIEGQAVILKADLERRGVVLSIEGGGIRCHGDSAVIDRFAPLIVQCKKALLELLGKKQDVSKAKPKSWRDRDAAYWARVRESVAPGVQKICAQLLHAYPLLIDGLNAGTLPAGGCRVVVRGQEHNPEDVAFSLKEIFAMWGETAASCHEEHRDLTEEETDGMNETIEILEWLNAANMGDHWADLETLLDGAGEASQMRAQQRKAEREGA